MAIKNFNNYEECFQWGQENNNITIYQVIFREDYVEAFYVEDENDIPDEFKPQQPTLEEQLKELQNQLMTADERYKALDKTTVSIENLKTAKLAQLEELCEKSIVDGFDHTINDISYRFSCSINAQANFQGTDTLFKDGLITECEWTVTNNTTGTVERVMLDQTTFNQIKLQVFTHINSNISKLRNTLQVQVESALTNDEIDLIVW